jgi:plastocyanin
LANATVSFGAWPATGAVLDRTVLPTAPMAPNIHQLLPQTATIKAGGAVNFIVAGFHQIAVYAPGTKPEDIDTTTLIPIPNAPPAVGLIDDANNRLFRGVSPLTVEQDRVEVVHFGKPGRYLVICTVSVHFAGGMYGWVRVLPD